MNAYKKFGTVNNTGTKPTANIGAELYPPYFSSTNNQTVSVAAGKKMRIYPHFDGVTAAACARIVLKTNSWYTTTLLRGNTSNLYWDFTIPSNGKFSLILPGGNNGDTQFKFE